MRSVFLATRAQPAFDVSSDEMEFLDIQTTEISTEQFFDATERLHRYCQDGLEAQKLSDVLSSAETYSNACHDQICGQHIGLLALDQLTDLLNTLTTILGFAKMHSLTDLTVIALKCISNTACLRNISLFVNLNLEFRTLLKQALFAEDLHERYMAITLFHNVYSDFKYPDKQALCEEFAIANLLDVEYVSALLQQRKHYTRRYFKDLVDIIAWVPFSIDYIICFFLFYLKERPADEFSKFMFTTATNLIKRFSTHTYGYRYTVIDWIFHSYSVLISKYSSCQMAALRTEFLSFLAAAIEHMQDEMRTRFLLQQDLIFDLQRFYPQPLDRRSKQIVASLVVDCYESYASLFETPQISKDCSYYYMIQCMNPESIRNVVLIVGRRVYDLVRNFPTVLERFFCELNNFLVNNFYFYENSLGVNSKEQYVGQLAISCILYVVECKESWRAIVFEYKHLKAWLEDLRTVSLENEVDVAFIFGDHAE